MDALAEERGGIRKLFGHRATSPLDDPNRSAVFPDVARASGPSQADHIVIFAQKGVVSVFVQIPQLLVTHGVFENDHPPIHRGNAPQSRASPGAVTLGILGPSLKLGDP